MEGPIIAVDVSNGSSHFRCFEKDKDNSSKPFFIKHNIEGFDYLKLKIEELSKKTGKPVGVVYEATGVYDKPLQRYLDKNNITYYKIAPLESAAKRKGQIHGKKSDKRDPIDIAAVYYDKPVIRPFGYEEEIYHKMRCLNRHYEDIIEHLRKYKVSFQESLSICFPGYLSLFDDGYSDVAMCILEKYPHPDLIKRKKKETVAEYITKHTVRTKKIALRYAEKVIEFANITYPGCDKDDIQVDIMVERIHKINEVTSEGNEVLQKLIDLAKTLPNYEIIKSIDGIGENLASRIIAEIGDIERFDTREALVAYSGCDPQRDQSGDKDGEHLPITKKGNKRLRCLLYLAVSCSIRVGKDNPINRFYDKKKQQSNPLKPKAAKIACTTKLLKIIYGMCKNGTTYQR